MEGVTGEGEDKKDENDDEAAEEEEDDEDEGCAFGVGTFSTFSPPSLLMAVLLLFALVLAPTLGLGVVCLC